MNKLKKFEYYRESDTPSLLKSLNFSIENIHKHQNCTELKVQESHEQGQSHNISPNEVENYG